MCHGRLYCCQKIYNLQKLSCLYREKYVLLSHATCLTRVGQGLSSLTTSTQRIGPLESFLTCAFKITEAVGRKYGKLHIGLKTPVTSLLVKLFWPKHILWLHILQSKWDRAILLCAQKKRAKMFVNISTVHCRTQRIFSRAGDLGFYSNQPETV